MRQSARVLAQGIKGEPTITAVKSGRVTKAKHQLPSKDKSSVERPNGQARTSIVSKARSQQESDNRLADKKQLSWSKNANASPFPEFERPLPKECREAHRVLHKMHHKAVQAEFNDPNTPETIPNVLDAMIVAVLSQATSWSNAKRAMDSMRETYGSVFAYDEIKVGGVEKLQETLRCGGLHIRKTKSIMSILDEVSRSYSDWNLNGLFEMSNEDAMQELLKFKYIGPKSASVVLAWCLKRNSFTVDTHVYRISGLFGWRPQNATREATQAHLDAKIPPELKFDLHFLMIAHGRTCPSCRGGAKPGKACELRKQIAS